MKFREIITEDESQEDQLASDGHSGLISVLLFLRSRSENKGLTPKLRTDSLINLVQNTSNSPFDYAMLADAHETSDAVKELIKSFNEQEVILSSNFDDDAEQPEADGEEPIQDPVDTVDQMAKRATANRQ